MESVRRPQLDHQRPAVDMTKEKGSSERRYSSSTCPFFGAPSQFLPLVSLDGLLPTNALLIAFARWFLLYDCGLSLVRSHCITISILTTKMNIFKKTTKITYTKKGHVPEYRRWIQKWFCIFFWMFNFPFQPPEGPNFGYLPSFRKEVSFTDYMARSWIDDNDAKHTCYFGTWRYLPLASSGDGSGFPRIISLEWCGGPRKVRHT